MKWRISLKVAAIAVAVGLALRGSSAQAEPIKPLSHRDRLYDVTAAGDELYAVGHPGLVLRSRDGGKSFESVRAAQSDDALFSVAFNKVGQGAVAGRSGVVLTTLDHGKTWQRNVVKMGEEQPSLFSITVLASGVILAVGEFGAIARSEDHGRSWVRSPYTINIAKAVKGQAASDPRCLAPGVLERENSDVIQEARLTDVAFADDRLGFITSEFGLLLRSDDGGRTFERQASCTDKTLYSVSVVSLMGAIAVGAEGTMLETHDGGLTWTLCPSATPEHLFGVYANAEHTLVLGAAGVALSRDGQGPFELAETGVHGWLSSAWFDDSGKGVLVGGRGYLRRTDDGGKTQQKVFGE